MAPSGEAPAGTITYLEAIRAALQDAMREDDRVFLLGEDIGAFGGAFGVTAGLFDEFGEDRVIDTPIAEEGFVGAAIGAAWMGERPVVELQFADFITCPFDTIVTVAAKTHWRSGQQIPITIRCPTGGGVRGGPFHAGSPEGWFVGTAGPQDRLPRHVEDAYGLLRAAIDDPDPVLYFEHKRALPHARAEHRRRGHRTPIGPAAIARAGADATVVTYGSGVATALAAAEPSTPTSRSSTCARSGRSTRRRSWPRSRRPRASSCCRKPPARPAPPGVILSLIARRSFEHLDAPPALHRAARYARSVRARARGCLHAVCRLDDRRPRPAARLLMPIEPCAEAPSIGSDERVALFRLCCCSACSRTGCWRSTARAGSRAPSTPGRGQEAVAAGAGLALGPDDVVAPLNRELACHFARGAPPRTCSATSSARLTSPTLGRDGNMHFGAPRAASFRSSRCSATSCPSSRAPRSRSSAAASLGSR